MFRGRRRWGGGGVSFGVLEVVLFGLPGEDLKLGEN